MGVDNDATDAAEVENLKRALETRTVIAEAKGILMERYGLSEEAAFALLKRLSMDTNVRVHDLAARLVETRELPDR